MTLGGVSYRRWAAGFLFGLLAVYFTDAAPAPRPGKPPVIPSSRVHITILGFESAEAALPSDTPVEVVETPYDVIVVGGGLSGLCAGWYVGDQRTLILERNEVAGGLAFRGQTKEGVIYGRGSAYYSYPEGQVAKIYEELGFDPLEKTAIPEPIDSFYHQGKLHRGVWEEQTLKGLPRDFRKFKEALLDASERGMVSAQPIEEAKDMRLDKMTAAEFIRRFDPAVKAFLDSYSQSALGAKTDQVNAMAFCNFYLAEIETRYAWPGGTAGASAHLIKKLNTRNPAQLRPGATVLKVRQLTNAVEVTWQENSTLRRARARFVVMAVPLRVAAWVMEDYPADRRELVARLPYADYLVHTVFTSRELFTASYDTWFANRRLTDVIAARWLETSGFKRPSAGPPGVLSLYQPLEPSRRADLRSPESVRALALAALNDVTDMIPALADEPKLEIESYRWPSSIHVVPVNFFSQWARKLREPVGRVYFAGNNLGTPSFEEALYRGWRAAQEIRPRLAARD